MNTVIERDAAQGHLPAVAASGKIPLGRKIKAYIHLTKPQIIELLLVTTAPTMIFAAGGFTP